MGIRSIAVTLAAFFGLLFLGGAASAESTGDSVPAPAELGTCLATEIPNASMINLAQIPVRCLLPQQQ